MDNKKMLDYMIEVKTQLEDIPSIMYFQTTFS